MRVIKSGESNKEKQRGSWREAQQRCRERKKQATVAEAPPIPQSPSSIIDWDWSTWDPLGPAAPPDEFIPMAQDEDFGIPWSSAPAGLPASAPAGYDLPHPRAANAADRVSSSSSTKQSSGTSGSAESLHHFIDSLVDQPRSGKTWWKLELRGRLE